MGDLDRLVVGARVQIHRKGEFFRPGTITWIRNYWPCTNRDLFELWTYEVWIDPPSYHGQGRDITYAAGHELEVLYE